MLIILDRDGVINEDSDDFVKTPQEWQPIPGSLAAIAALNRAGHTITIATNQSGIGRGLYTVDDLTQIHTKMQNALAAVGGHVDAIFYCPHHPDADCQCRKPKPGMLLAISAQYRADLSQALMVGDALRDIECAKAVGCPAVLVQTGKGAQVAANLPQITAYEDLAHLVAHLLQNPSFPGLC